MPSKTDYELALDKLAVGIDKLSKDAYKRLMALLETHTPREALDIVYLSFKAQSYNAVYAALLAKSFTELLKRPFTVQQMLDYPIGNVKLSTKLYANAAEISKAVTKVIQDQAATFHDLRKMTLSLYSGYDIKSQEVLKVKDVLPKYLKRAYEPFAAPVDREIAKLLASDLKTDGLRAAYSTFLDKLEKDAAPKALAKALQAAAAEKSRYLASRIAQNELSIAYSKAEAMKILNRKEISVVQIRPSGSHTPDICDAILFADNFNLGIGRYPAKEAPRPPFHHFCRCRAIAIVNEKAPDNTQRDPDSTRAYLSSLTEEERLTVAGSKNNLEKLMNGGRVSDQLNKGHTEAYKVRTLNDSELPI